MATFVMLAGILFFLQRAWSSFLARPWKSIATQKEGIQDRKIEIDLFKSGWQGSKTIKTRRFGLRKILDANDREWRQAISEGQREVIVGGV